MILQSHLKQSASKHQDNNKPRNRAHAANLHTTYSWGVLQLAARACVHAYVYVEQKRHDHLHTGAFSWGSCHSPHIHISFTASRFAIKLPYHVSPFAFNACFIRPDNVPWAGSKIALFSLNPLNKITTMTNHALSRRNKHTEPAAT